MKAKNNIDNLKQQIHLLSHEISNPLNTISLNAQLLKRASDDDTLKRAAVIDNCVDRMKNMMYKMLEIIDYSPNPIKNAKIIDLNKFREKKMLHF
jgi:nitrogen-specific signal transduction histidine kinase